VIGAFLVRMGMPASRQAVSTALEAAGLVLFAGLAGTGSALLAARPIVTRVDPLPQWAPAATVAVPWTLIALSLVAVVVLAAIAGAFASAFAARGDLGEALRVA
jgi:ABC-type antimicrobial peptide transport system permease subunit